MCNMLIGAHVQVIKHCVVDHISGETLLWNCGQDICYHFPFGVCDLTSKKEVCSFSGIFLSSLWFSVSGFVSVNMCVFAKCGYFCDDRICCVSMTKKSYLSKCVGCKFFSWFKKTFEAAAVSQKLWLVYPPPTYFLWIC